MTLAEIRSFPQVHNNVHESVFRSYQVLDKVCELLAAKVPHEVIREIIQDLNCAPCVVSEGLKREL